MFFVGLGKIITFALKIVKVLLLMMSISNIFGIPFRITCCGGAASQFYNPLQESTSSDLRATIGGGDPANVARIIFINDK